MEQKIPRHKGVYILPNLFTTASLFTAFLSMVWAHEGSFMHASLAIFISAVMDGLDGKVARLTGTSSEFGIQYDSLADLVAFGIAPAFLVYTFSLHEFSRLGIAVAFLFAVCSALRLARFNITSTATSKRFFTGLPTPAAGCALGLFVFIRPDFPDFLVRFYPYLCLLLTLLIAFLMVSSLRYAAFKEFGFLKVHPFRYMVFTILLFALFIAQSKLIGSLLLFGYIFSGLVYSFIILPRKGLTVSKHHAMQQANKENSAKKTEPAPEKE